LEARLLSTLDKVLTAEGPANVDRESVTVTGEGATVTIALIPHRDLGGYSLTVSLLPARFLLGWAPVFDLESHDDLDLAEVVTDWQAAGWPGDDRVAAARRASKADPRPHNQGSDIPTIPDALRGRGRRQMERAIGVPNFFRPESRGACRLHHAHRPRTAGCPLSGANRAMAAMGRAGLAHNAAPVNSVSPWKS